MVDHKKHDQEVQKILDEIFPPKVFTRAQVDAIQAALLKRVIKIHADSYSRGGFRVVLHNMIVELEGSGPASKA